MPFKQISQTDFSGGVNYVTNPYLTNQKQSSHIHNLILDEHGSLHTRGGLRTLTTSLDTDHPIIYRGVYIKNDGTEFPVAIHSITTGNKLYVSSPWGLVGTFTTNELTPTMVQLNNKAIFLNGYETPFQWDGTTFSRITVSGGQTLPPGAKHGSFHLGAMWIWNTNPDTTTLDGPSSLRMSDANNPNSWPNTNQTFVSKDDGQVGMGCSSFTIVETGISPTATLVLFKNFSAYEVTGVFGAGNFSVQQVKSDMGCIAPRTIQFVSGFGLIRLTHKGFSLYNGVEDRLISEEIRPKIFGGISGNEFISGLDFSNIKVSYAAQIPNPPIYIAACPVSSSGELTRIFFYDLVRRAWTIGDFPVALSCLALLLSPNSIPLVQAGAFTGGKIYEVFPINVFHDDGNHVEWSLKTRAYFNTNQMNPSYFRRLLINVLGEPKHPVYVTPIIDNNPAQTQTFLMPDGGIGIPSHTSQAALVDTVLSVDIMRAGHTVQFQIDGVGRSYIRGLEVHTTQKPPMPYIAEVVRVVGPVIPEPVHTFIALRKIKIPATLDNTWDFLLDGSTVATDLDNNEGVTVEIEAGSHTVTEELSTGSDDGMFAPIFSGDLDANGTVDVAEGATASGIVTNVSGVSDVGNRLFSTGFEEGNAACELDGNTNSIKSVIFDNSAGIFTAPSISTTFAHTGTYSLYLTGPGGLSGGFPSSLGKTLSPALSLPSSYGYSYYMYMDSVDATPNRLTHILVLGPSATTAEFLCTGYKSIGIGSAHPLLERGQGTQSSVGATTLNSDTWYRVEAYITVEANGAYTSTASWYEDDSTTALETLTLSGAAGTYNTSHTINLLAFTSTYGIAPAATDMYIDDLRMFAYAGPYGPAHIILGLPDEVVTSTWDVHGAGDAADAIDWLPTSLPWPTSNNDTTSTTSITDRFTMTNPVPANAVVTYMDVYAYTAFSDVANASLALMIFSPGASNSTMERESSVFTTTNGLPTTGVGHYALKFAADTPASYLDDFDIGYRSKLSGSGSRAVKALWANIEYTI